MCYPYNRCGMVWFSHEVVTPRMNLSHYLNLLSNDPLDENEREFWRQKKEQQKEDPSINLGSLSFVVVVVIVVVIIINCCCCCCC